MEMVSDDHKAGILISKGWLWLKALVMGLIAKLYGIARKAKALAKDDPRRVVHSLKLGLALTIVSFLYYFKPLYDNFGVSAMWAVITVVVVFEFSVGATLGRGLNRGLGTLFAGALGVGAHNLASLSGHIAQPILTSIFVFILAVALTFLRFFPTIKAKYDYGMVMSILTFSLVSISGVGDDEILELLQKRVSTIFLGVSVCVAISIFVYPIWAGEDLHNRIALNIENLAIFLEGFGVAYFRTCEDREFKDETFSQEYKSVLNSRSVEELLYNFARWEPGHGCFQFRHPWNQYLIIGTLTHQCAYRIDALSSNLAASNLQVSQEIKSKIQESCIEMSMESGKALRQLASSIREMSEPSVAEIHKENAKAAAKRLKASLKSGLWEDCDLFTIIPAATVASLLIDVVECTQKLVESVQQLASMAHFKRISHSQKSEPTQSDEDQKVQPRNGISFATIPNPDSGLANQICTQV